jgi:aldose 1-epimerase
MRLSILLLLSLMPLTAQYTARRTLADGVEVIRLEDAAHRTSLSVAPSIGNIAFELMVNGHNVLWFPYPSVAAFRDKPRICGIPLLAPWADRLDENAFYANGKKYRFNPDLSNIRLDGAGHPIHGFLSLTADWQVLRVEADSRSARVSSRLDVTRRPEWMAQFPFAHTIEITHTLRDGSLEVSTRVENRSEEPMPLSIGYHSFYQINDAPRDDWTVGLGAAREWPVDKELLPTGQTRPLSELIPSPSNFNLRGLSFDNVLGDLIRDPAGRAAFWVKGKRQKIEVLYGPRYIAGEIYAPLNRDFICFEPMAGIDNAINLAHRGVYKELQMIPPGKVWQESFWIRPAGF